MGLVPRCTDEGGKHECGTLSQADQPIEFHPKNATLEFATEPVCFDERTSMRAWVEPKDPEHAKDVELYLLKEKKSRRGTWWKVVGYKTKAHKKAHTIAMNKRRRKGCYMWAVMSKPDAAHDIEYDFWYHTWAN